MAMVLFKKDIYKSDNQSFRKKQYSKTEMKS